MATLYWVSLASRPLSVTEISDALAVRTDSAKNPFDISRVCSNSTLLACCMGLVIIDEETSTVRLVHYSLQEFLQNDNDPEVSLFHIHTGHGLIAKTCLTYLRFCQSMTLEMAASCECQKRYGGKKIWWEYACICRSEFPLFSHASLEWGNHVREGYDTSIGSLAVEWLTAKETASCPCAIMYMSLVRDKYRYSSYPGHWYSSQTTPCHSLLVLHSIAYFGAHILEEVATTVSQLELNAKDKQGWTALTWAAARGHDLFVKQLLKYKETEVDIMDTRGFTPLMHAAWHGNAKVVKQLLALDNSRRVNLNAYSIDGRTAISYAAAKGHCAIIEILLRETEVDPNYTSTSQTTPLMYAIQEGMTNTAKALLSDHRVTPTLQDKNGDTALHLAVKARAVEVLKLLLQDPRVDPNHKGMDDYTPLDLAAESGHTEILKLLLGELRVDPNHESRNSYTPLALAAKYGYAEAIEVLLGDPRVDPNQEDRDGYTPLTLAATDKVLAWQGRAVEVLKLLLRNPRVDPNHENRDGYTPLALAIEWRHTEILKSLLGDLRVDPNRESRNSYTPLALAARCGYAEAVKVLLRDPRVNPNPIHSTGDTPLLISIKKYLCGGYYSPYGRNLIDVLLTHSRVDRNIRDSGGRTALSYVVASNSWLYPPPSLYTPPEYGVDLEIVTSLLEGSGEPISTYETMRGRQPLTGLYQLISEILTNVENSSENTCQPLHKQEML